MLSQVHGRQGKKRYGDPFKTPMAVVELDILPSINRFSPGACRLGQWH